MAKCMGCNNNIAENDEYLHIIKKVAVEVLVTKGKSKIITGRVIGMNGRVHEGCPIPGRGESRRFMVVVI